MALEEIKRRNDYSKLPSKKREVPGNEFEEDGLEAFVKGRMVAINGRMARRENTGKEGVSLPFLPAIFCILCVSVVLFTSYHIKCFKWT